MIREFSPTAGDYERVVAINALVNPDHPADVETIRYRDRTWDPAQRKLRLVFDRDGQVLGWGQLAHMWWAFHPRRYAMRVEVDPAERHKGIGSALHDRFLQTLHEWDAELVRTETAIDEGVAWLEKRGYSEIQRRHALRLLLADVDQKILSEPPPAGVRITTFAEERALKGDDLPREIYALEIIGGEDEPRPEQDTPMSFDRFVSQELIAPSSLFDGNFLAYEDDRLIGLSRLETSPVGSQVLHQGFTTVHPDVRGRGVARALKVCTLRYAIEHGYQEIRTTNDLTNAPMLHINYALGFREMLERIVFERRFEAAEP